MMFQSLSCRNLGRSWSDDQKQQMKSLETIVNVLGQIERENALGTLTLNSLADYICGLQRRSAHDFALCNFSSIASSFALPLFKEIFQGWDPLQNPSHIIEIMIIWKNVLQRDEYLYTQLVSDVVLPAVRMFRINTWDARDPEPMLRFLESWEDLLPSSVLETILDTIILPKLSSVVDSWDPCQKAVPIHVWVHPWLPMLGHKFESLYNTIHVKLRDLLEAWHPNDVSVYNIVSPWKPVFDSADWEELMRRYVFPKMKVTLQELQIKPMNQKLDQFCWVLSWASAIPIHLMAYLMEKFFFPKWLQVLYQWLNTSPNFEGIREWYMGWKGLLPQELLANENIMAQLVRGLNMMSQAADSKKVVQPVDVKVVQPFLKENCHYISSMEKRLFEAQNVRDAQGEMSLKEIVDSFAQQHELLFKSKPGQMSDGKQVYAFGKISIYLDPINQMVYARKKEGWTAVTLDTLLRMSLE